MIIYIHGFGGSGEGQKARLLRQALKKEGIIAPSLPTHPTLAVQTLRELIERFRQMGPVGLIGSSLGGFYALHLSQSFESVRVVVINPSINPDVTLRRAIGPTGGINFYDGSRYEWNEAHIEALKALRPTVYRSENLLLLTQLGDELLDANEAIEALKGCEQVIEEGGDHSFSGLERHIDRIRGFLR